MVNLAIMQPTFLPWAGYFNLISSATDFIFLDDVQLEKQSWQTRNRLLLNGGVQWITLPIRNESISQKITETNILMDARWKKKFTTSFSMNYGRHPNFISAKEIVDELIRCEDMRLSEVNEKIIRLIVTRLKLSTKLHTASKLNINGVRTQRLISFCDHFSATTYLSPVGASKYLELDGFEKYSTSQLNFQDFQSRPYNQFGNKEFVPGLSMLDVIANLGWKETRKYIDQEYCNE